MKSLFNASMILSQLSKFFFEFQKDLTRNTMKDGDLIVTSLKGKQAIRSALYEARVLLSKAEAEIEKIGVVDVQ